MSFDTKVESELVGVRASKGSRKGTAGKAVFTLPSGEISKPLAEFGKPKKVAMPHGETRASATKGTKFSSGSRVVLDAYSGNHRLFLSWSASLTKGKSSKPPAVSAEKVVPYLLKVRDRIMLNWKSPCIGVNVPSKDKKVVIYITIAKNGRLTGIDVDHLSSDMAFNRAALLAIYASEPFEPIPSSVKVEKIKVKVNFELK
jgi:protein TonB